MKLKFNETKLSYSITGLNYEHLNLLATLLNQVRLGSGGASALAFDFAELFEDELIDGDLPFKVAKGETGKYVKDPVIEV